MVFLTALIAAAVSGLAQPIVGSPDDDVKRSPVPSGGRDLLAPELYKVQFTSESMLRAYERAKREHKVLIAVFRKIKGPFNRRNWWEQPSVAAWTRWHAIVVAWDDSMGIRPSGLSAFSRRKDLQVVQTRDWLGFAVFANNMQCFLPERDLAKLSDPPWLTSTTVLGVLDIALQAAKLRDLPFGILHDRSNPSPAPPDEPTGLWKDGDGLAAPYEPPGYIDGQLPDVLGVLLEARRMTREFSSFTANGRYTWLMEEGGKVDAAFEPYRLMVLPDELRVLAQSDANLQERILQLRDRASLFLPWADPWRKLCWLSLGHGCNDVDTDVAYLDEELHDGDMKALVTRTEYYAYMQMVAALDTPAWNDLPGSLKRAEALAVRKVPRDVHRDDIAKVETFTKRLALYEACRAYALALRSNREPEAAQASALALRLASTQPPGMVKRMLVATAIAEGHAGAPQRAWLVEAATEQKRSVESDPLLAHITAP